MVVRLKENFGFFWDDEASGVRTSRKRWFGLGCIQAPVFLVGPSRYIINGLQSPHPLRVFSTVYGTAGEWLEGGCKSFFRYGWE